MKTCQKSITMQLPYMGTSSEYCGKPSVIIDTHGRALCQKHYNRWVKKCNKSKLKSPSS